MPDLIPHLSSQATSFVREILNQACLSVDWFRMTNYVLITNYLLRITYYELPITDY